jgi:O-antigen/teichoic acid export membrane protein
MMENINITNNHSLGSIFRDSLYKNSVALILSRIFNIISGFIFWIVAARYYTISDVGIGTAFLSSLTLVATLSMLGYDKSIIKYISFENRLSVYNTCQLITASASIIISTIYIIFVILFPSLGSYILKFSLYFIIFSIFNTITLTQGNLFLSVNGGKYFLIQTIILWMRIPLLFFFNGLGGAGIFFAIGLSFLFSSLIGRIWVGKYVKFDYRFDNDFAKESLRFSFMNYLANVLYILPLLLLPIIVLNALSPQDAARFFIAFQLGSMMLLVPDSISRSLFVEGYDKENFKNATRRAIILIYSLLIPTFIGLYLFGDIVLSFFGKGYEETSTLLTVISFSNFFMAIHLLFNPIQNMRLNVKSIVVFNFLRLFMILLLLYLLIPKFRLMGVGYAWLIGNIIISILIVWLLNRTVRHAVN